MKILIFQDLNIEGCKSSIIEFVEHVHRFFTRYLFTYLLGLDGFVLPIIFQPPLSNALVSLNILFVVLFLFRIAAPCLVFPLLDCIIAADTSSLGSTFNSESESTLLTHFPSSPPTILTLPGLERAISSEYHHSNATRETDRLNWALSPPPPSYIQLPNCPICLRRIMSRVSHINEEESNERDKLIIGPSFIGHGDRCLVCHIYSDTSSSVTILLRSSPVFVS